jgi:hypothetical protein
MASICSAEHAIKSLSIVSCVCGKKIFSNRSGALCTIAALTADGSLTVISIIFVLIDSSKYFINREFAKVFITYRRASISSGDKSSIFFKSFELTS